MNLHKKGKAVQIPEAAIQETTSVKKINVDANNQNDVVSYEAHTHQLPKEGSHSAFNLYSKGLIEGEAKEELLHSGPIYWEGWGKFFHYTDEPEKHKPKDFYVNTEYFSQKVLKQDFSKRDDVGYINIPSKFHYFFSVTENNLILLSSRNRKLHKIIDTLHIDLINPIPFDNQEQGGVQNLGEFDEGNCIQVFTTIPAAGPNPHFKNTKDEGSPENWVLCFDSINDRSELMKTLIRIKTLKEKVDGDHFVKDTRLPSISKELRPKATPLIERYHGPGANIYKDGYWVLLQDWSQCTLECGGGVQFQQWLCQPPLKGGMPCQGQAIRKRPCNMKPCPQVLGVETHKKSDIEVVKKPIVKSLPWSSRLQRYIQCEVKESDILYIRRDVPNMIGKPVKYPGRLVMTNRTLAMYEDDTFERNIFTFNLQDTTVAQDKEDFCCFFASSQDKRFKVCGFENDCGTKKDPHFFKEWNSHFNMFQQKCYNDLEKKDWKDALKRDQEDADGGHVNADQDKIDAREAMIKHKIKEKEDLELEKKITNTQETALKAIRKELKLERLIKEEEKMKEKNKMKDLLRLKVSEQKKMDCLEKAIKRREDENSKGRDAVLAEKEINRIKDQTKKEVENERNNLRRKLQEFKKHAGRKQKQVEQQINLIRSQMAQNLMNANKLGDMLICKNSSKDQELINKYCDTNFVTNYKKNQECKDPENFCPMCCENEFGNMYLNKRDECYNLCDEENKNDLKGDWIWTKEGFHKTK